jgi:predicted dehydrogenase
VARNRPRPRALKQRQSSLQAVGLEPGSRLALAVAAAGGRSVESIDELHASHVVIGPRAADVARLAGQVLASGARVMVEEPAAVLAGDTPIALDQMVAPFTFRFEPSAESARSSLRAGSIGLPFAVTAEAVGTGGGDSARLACDLLDAVLLMTGLALEATCALSVDPHVFSCLWSHGVVGDVSALATSSADLHAMVHIRGSHGSLSVNLAAPHVIAVSQRVVHLRLGESGAARLIARFCAGVALPTLKDWATLVASTRHQA